MNEELDLRITDEAAEFAETMTHLKNHSSNNTNAALHVFRELIVGGERDSDALRALAVIHKRGRNLLDRIQSISSPDFPESLKDNSSNALIALQTPFLAQNLVQNWRDNIQRYLKGSHIVALKYTSIVMRRTYPIKKIKEDDIARGRELLDAAAQELMRDQLPEWANIIVSRGIQDLIFILDNYFLFGYDEVLHALIELAQQVNAITPNLLNVGANRLGLQKLAIAFVFLTDLFCAAPNISAAIPWYREKYSTTLNAAVALLPSPSKAIEGPKRPSSKSKPNPQTSRSGKSPRS